MPDRTGLDDTDSFRAEFATALSGAAGPLGLVLSDSEMESLSAHAHAVREANCEVNLTAITDAVGMAIRHALDSLVPSIVWPECVGQTGHAIDLGSGAGYPGLPLAIRVPGVHVTLLDATRKKVERLATFATGVPNAEVRWGRAEDLAHDGMQVERVWVRAVGPLPVLVELSFGLLGPGGWMVAWKGTEALGEEWKAGADAARALGGRAVGTRPYALGAGVDQRTLMVFERGRRDLPDGFPRPPAVILRHPLV